VLLLVKSPKDSIPVHPNRLVNFDYFRCSVRSGSAGSYTCAGFRHRLTLMHHTTATFDLIGLRILNFSN